MNMKEFLIVAVVVLACGCSYDVGDSLNGGADVTETTLSDGTRCAALIGPNKGGLSCDWANATKQRREF